MHELHLLHITTDDLMISPSEVITIEGEDIQVLCTPFRPELPSILEIRVPGIVDEFTPVLRLMGFLNVSTSDAGTLFTLLSSNIERSLNGAQLRCLMGERTSGFANLTVFCELELFLIIEGWFIWMQNSPRGNMYGDKKYNYGSLH